MKKYNSVQIKSLAEFFNMLAAAWFTAGVISPFFAGLNIRYVLVFIITGITMTWASLKISLFLLKEVKI